MQTTVLSKPASELTTDELSALLAQRQANEVAEKNEKRKAYETLRDETVKELVEGAKALNDMLSKFKSKSYASIGALYEMLQEHSDRHANGKGNVTLDSSCGNYRIMFRRHDATRFDERSTQAEAHILDFLTAEYPEGSPTNKAIRILLERKTGQLDKNNVLKLFKMKDDFDNENWRKGIDLLQESIVPDHTKYYAQFFYRSGDMEWLPIVLEFAKL